MKTSDLFKSENQKQYLVFKSMQFRWEETADPEREDVEFHLTKEAAIEAAEAISLNVGFYPLAEMISIPVGNISDDEEFELADLENYNEYQGDCEEVWSGSEFKGESIEGAIIIEWSWEKYVGYARNLKDIGTAGQFPFHAFKTENDLISGNEERTFRSNYSILLTAEEISKSDNLQESIEEALNASSWKWNHFKNNPQSQHIVEKIEEISK